MPVILKKTFAIYIMVRVSHQLHFWRSPSIAVFPNGLLFLHLNLNLETIMYSFSKIFIDCLFFISKCVIGRVWLFHLYML